MALLKIREYEITPEHLDETKNRPVAPSMPVVWVRDYLTAGDQVGIYYDTEHPGRIVLEKIDGK
jgi:hypothetical protein